MEKLTNISDNQNLKRLLTNAMMNDGASWRVKELSGYMHLYDADSVGYMVARKEFETIIPLASMLSQVTQSLIYQYAERALELTRQTGRAHCVGLWIPKNDQRVFIDISVRYHDEAQALDVAKDEQQLAIWDSVNGVEITAK